MSFTRRTLFPSLAQISALLVAILVPISLMAQEAPKKEFTDKVSESLQSIGKKLTESPQDFDGAIRDIDALLVQVKPESYDTAYLSQMKAQAYIGKLDYIACLPPLETAYRLSKAYGFFDKTQELGLLWMLAQLYVQDASSEKNMELQNQKFSKALATVRDWLSQTPKPTFEAYYFAATILYHQATGGGSLAEPNKELLKQAADECQNALTTAIRPRDTIYQLLVAISQSSGDQDAAARYLELMVAANPKSGQYWTMLLATYLTAAEGMPEGSFLRNDAYAKAVYTIERAQKNGFMSTPQDYQRLFACYFNSGQFEGCIDVLEGGLRNGKVDSDQKNWELLSSCYLQINQTQKAIDTLVEAAKKYPDKGDIDMQIGYLYYGIEQYRDALDFMKIARDKGVVESKLASLLFFIGYLHYELKELDEALESVNKSLEIDSKSQNPKDVQRAILEAIAERERSLGRNQPAATAPAAANQPQPQAAAQQPAQ
jgi:tetratricopeptide (TPR) repeat protein